MAKVVILALLLGGCTAATWEKIGQGIGSQSGNLGHQLEKAGDRNAPQVWQPYPRPPTRW